MLTDRRALQMMRDLFKRNPTGHSNLLTGTTVEQRQAAIAAADEVLSKCARGTSGCRREHPAAISCDPWDAARQGTNK